MENIKNSMQKQERIEPFKAVNNDVKIFNDICNLESLGCENSHFNQHFVVLHNANLATYMNKINTSHMVCRFFLS